MSERSASQQRTAHTQAVIARAHRVHDTVHADIVPISFDDLSEQAQVDADMATAPCSTRLT